MRIPLICLIFSLSYLCFLVVSILFVEAMLPFDNRVLFPFLIVLVVGLVSLCRNAVHLAKPPKWLALPAVALAAMLLLVQGREMLEVSTLCGQFGVGFAGREWKNSKALSFLKKVPKDTLIYSNGPDVIDILLERQAKMIPAKRISSTRQDNVDFQKQMEDMVHHLRTTQGVLAYLNSVTWRWYLPSIEEVRKYGEFRPIYEGVDGVIYQVGKLAD